MAERDKNYWCELNFRWQSALLCFLFAVFFCVNPISAHAIELPQHSADINEASKTLTLQQIAEKIDDLKKRVRIAQLAENDQTAQQLGITLAELSERTGRLRSIQSNYERLLTALKKKAIQQKEEALLREKLQAERVSITELPPYNLSFYDKIIDELAAAQRQKETAALSEKLSKRTLEDTNLRLEDVRKEWRRLQELFNAKPNKQGEQQLAWDLEKIQLEVEFLESLLRVEKATRDNLIKLVEVSELRVELSQRKAALVRDHLHYDETDFKKQVDALTQARADLEKQVQDLAHRQENAKEKWLKAQRQQAVTPDGKPEPVGEAYLKAREAWHETYQTALEQTEERLRLLDQQEQIWRLRYALVKGDIQHRDMVSRKAEIDSQIKHLGQMLDIQQSYHLSIQSQIISLEKAAAEKDLDPSIKSHLRNHIAALQKSAEQQLEFTSALLATKQLEQRVLEEVGLGLQRVDLKQRLLNIKGQAQDILDFEVWAIDNKSVTVRKIIVALFILIIGILAAKYFLRAVTNRLSSVARLKETTVSSIQKILTYFAYLLVLLFALRMVNIPLTAFAFLGGAIAIGVGFGAQNLINNFISGFIMMAERPINIGDLIEVEGILGQVEEIGARCTRVRTGENIHILIPNSSFLEKNITNWTLSDRKIRAKVTTGVVYGSPVREVERLLLKAVHENDKVIKSPEPFVLFSDFGDNALIFEVYFWISVRRVIERRLIESGIRFRIDELFREAGIVIAFPQRDVHLDTLQPLEFRLIDKKDTTP